MMPIVSGYGSKEEWGVRDFKHLESYSNNPEKEHRTPECLGIFGSQDKGIYLLGTKQ